MAIDDTKFVDSYSNFLEAENRRLRQRLDIVQVIALVLLLVVFLGALAWLAG